MFAHAVEFDVADNYHILALHLENGSVDDLFQILLISARQIFQTFADTFRCFLQSFALGVLPELKQYILDFFFHKKSRSMMIKAVNIHPFSDL